MTGPRLLCALVVVAASLAGLVGSARADERAVVHAWDPAPASADAPDATARALALVRAAGLAVIDASPRAPAPPALAASLVSAIATYEGLHFDEAVRHLETLARAIDQWGGADLSAEQLFEAHLYRGLAHAQVSGEAAAWDAFVAAAAVAPGRILDPERFSPRILERFDRARAAVLARGDALIEVPRPAGCAVWLDGTPLVAAQARVVVGPHWLRGACGDRAATGRRFEIRPGGEVLSLFAPVPPAPGDAEILAAAARVGARTVVAIAIEDGLAIVRQLDGIRGERARRLVDLAPAHADQALADATVALADRLPPPARTSAWKVAGWVALGAAVATAIALPFALRQDSSSSLAIRPTGLPSW